MIQIILIGMLLQQPPAPAAGGNLSGRLVYSDGLPAPAYNINLVPVTQPGQPPAAPLNRGLRTDGEGNYRAGNIPAGRYYVRTGAPDAWTYYPGVPGETGATAITIGPAPAENINFALPPSASGVRVMGGVTFAEQRPAGAAPVSVQITGGVAPLSAPVSPDGRFEILHVRPGSYQVVATPAPGMQPVRITVADRDVTDVELAAPRLITVSGAVVADDRSRPGFVIGFVGAANSVRVPAAAANGSFTAQLPAGEYRILVQRMPAGYYIKTLTAGTRKSRFPKEPTALPPFPTAFHRRTSCGPSVTVRRACSPNR